MAAVKLNPRSYINLQSNDVRELQKAFNLVFDGIYQLQSTIVKEKLFLAAANDDLVLALGEETIPGTPLKLEAGVYLILGVFDWQAVSPNEVRGFLTFNGIKRTSPYAKMFVNGGTAFGEITAQVWTVSSASAFTVGLQARKLNAGAGQVNKDNTQLIAVKL